MFSLTIILSLFLPIKTMANQSYSQVASNLSLFIAPKYETESDFIKSQKVCECVAKKIKEAWTKEQFDSFDKELGEYAYEMNNFFEKSKVDVSSLSIGGTFPRPTRKLQEKLKGIIIFISPCEKEHKTEVEY